MPMSAFVTLRCDQVAAPFSTNLPASPSNRAATLYDSRHISHSCTSESDVSWQPCFASGYRTGRGIRRFCRGQKNG